MRLSLVLTAVAAVFACTLPASSATINTVQGEVLINQGDGFQPLKSAADLKAGSQVMVRPGGSATITYASTCSVKVPSGIWAVQSAPPCEAGTNLVDFTTRMNQEAPPPTDDTTVLIIGGIVVAGAVGAAILLSQDDSSSP